MPAGLASRSLTPEVMDDPALDPARHDRALVGLARLNRLSFSARSTWKAIRSLRPESWERSVRLLDLATGAGDALRAFSQFADRDGASIELAGADVSATALAHARRGAADMASSIDFIRCDVLEDQLPSGFDVLTCSLFLHHLTEDQIVSLLRKMAGAARIGFVVSDLRRSTLGYTLAALASRIVTRSDVVHIDALKSVRAALTMDEVRTLAAKAGLDVEVRRQFPQRFLLTWRASDGD